MLARSYCRCNMSTMLLLLLLYMPNMLLLLQLLIPYMVLLLQLHIPYMLLLLYVQTVLLLLQLHMQTMRYGIGLPPLILLLLPLLLIPLLQLVHAEGVAGHAGAHLQAHRAACASVC